MKKRGVMFKGRGKKGIESEVMVWWIIAIVVLAVMLVGYFILKSRGIGAIEFIKNMFRFGN